MIRKGSGYKNCKENGKQLCRTLTFIIPFHECNITNKAIIFFKVLVIIDDFEKNKVHVAVKLILFFPEMLVRYIILKVLDRRKPKTMRNV